MPTRVRPCPICVRESADRALLTARLYYVSIPYDKCKNKMWNRRSARRAFRPFDSSFRPIPWRGSHAWRFLRDGRTERRRHLPQRVVRHSHVWAIQKGRSRRKPVCGWLAVSRASERARSSGSTLYSRQTGCCSRRIVPYVATLTLQFEGAAYHVTARGNERKEIFRDDDDRLRFLKTLEDASSRFGLVIHAYCLMPNHYHLLGETPRGNLESVDRVAAGDLHDAVQSPARTQRAPDAGAIQAHLVESARSLGLVRPLICYIHLNPVRPKDRSKAVPVDRQPSFEQYPWSSQRAYVGTSAPPAWLSTEWLSHWQERAGLSPGVTRLRRAYRADVTACFREVIQSPWSALRGAGAGRRGTVGKGEAITGRFDRKSGTGVGSTRHRRPNPRGSRNWRAWSRTSGCGSGCA